MKQTFLAIFATLALAFFSSCGGSNTSHEPEWPHVIKEKPVSGIVDSCGANPDSIPVEIHEGAANGFANFATGDLPVFMLIKHYLDKDSMLFVELETVFDTSADEERLKFQITDCKLMLNQELNLTGLQARIRGYMFWLQEGLQKSLQPRPTVPTPTARKTPRSNAHQPVNIVDGDRNVPLHFAETEHGDPLPAGNCLPQSFTPAPNGPVFNITGNSGPINIVINGTIYNNQQPQQPVPCPVPPTPGEILH